jgi:hypothetical protein
MQTSPKTLPALGAYLILLLVGNGSGASISDQHGLDSQQATGKAKWIYSRHTNYFTLNSHLTEFEYLGNIRISNGTGRSLDESAYFVSVNQVRSILYSKKLKKTIFLNVGFSVS